MVMKKRGHGRKGQSQPQRTQAENSNSRDGPYNLDIVTSESFDKYYKAQGLLDGDEDWDEFMKVARSPLPMTFRITSSRDSSQAVNDHVKNEFVPHLSDVVFNGEKQAPPKVLEWYPAGLAWQLDVAKQVVRKSREFAKFQQFLVHETDSGNISRQEAVSMIPPLLLDVQPHHYVLDCCAAPGSKTVQLLEALHAKAPTSTAPAAPIPSGFLIANDSDAKRCHMLVHQSLNRIGSPNCMITNLDASAIPAIKIPNPQNGQTKNLYFDRILCDVPCSGDGTTRKNPGVWKTWKPADGLGLHSLQLRILSRAIQMLKPGGRLCYSTCSYNPIENEAVVSAALNTFPSMSLVDMSDALPGLKRKQGVTSWKVFDKQMNELASPDLQTSGSNSKPITETCWPSGKEAELHMERCLRLYPHQQNTGGFFVAVLEKKGDSSVSNATTSSAVAGTKRAASPSAEIQQESKKTRTEAGAAVTESGTSTPATEGDEVRMGAGRPFNEDPYSFLSLEDEQLKSCLDFFNFSPEFPADKLFVRNADGNPLRSVYLSSDMVRTILEHNDYTRLRLISCGVKILIRQDPGKTDTYRCRWRITQDGLPVLKDYMGPARKMTGDLKALRRLCTDLYPTMEAFEDGDFKNAIKDMENGSLICEFLPGNQAGGKLDTSIILPLWRAPNSVCLMVEKMEKKGLCMRIFGQDLSQKKNTNNKNGNKKVENGKDAKEAAVDGEVKAEGDLEDATVDEEATIKEVQDETPAAEADDAANEDIKTE